MLMLLVWFQVIFVCMIYGPIAAYLVEAFPARSAIHRSRCRTTSATAFRRVVAADRHSVVRLHRQYLRRPLLPDGRGRPHLPRWRLPTEGDPRNIDLGRSRASRAKSPVVLLQLPCPCPASIKLTSTVLTESAGFGVAAPAPSRFLPLQRTPSCPLSGSRRFNPQDLDSILRENRVFPPPAEFSRKAYVKSLEEYEAMYKRSIERSGRLLGRGREGTALVQAVGQGARVGSALGQVVRRRQDEPVLQLRRPSRAGRARATRPPSSGRASRAKSAA